MCYVRVVQVGCPCVVNLGCRLTLDENGQPKPLTLRAGAGSFRALLRCAKCTLAIARTVEQLQALGSVQLCDGGTRVRLLSNVLIVVAGNRFVVAPSIDSIRRFAETVEHNLCAGTPPGEGRIHRWAACEALDATELAGDEIIAALTSAPGNGAPIGGLMVVTATGWFAARPSGTEDVYKLYAESFRGPEQLAAIQDQAREIIAAAIG